MEEKWLPQGQAFDFQTTVVLRKTVFLSQGSEIQYDWTGLGHMSAFTQSLWGAGGVGCNDGLNLGQGLPT